MQKAQGSIEFFLIAGFILLATSVLLAQADNQIRGTSALNNVLVARSALDLETSALKYIYLSGNYSVISNKIFVPVGAQCFYVIPSESRMYCIVPGAAKRVVSETFDFPAPTVQSTCFKSGWITVRSANANGVLNVTCK
ncbi:MAG: hypothetical protein V1835_06380 [Candidatus Micrarchaeota archaeon]